MKFTDLFSEVDDFCDCVDKYSLTFGKIMYDIDFMKITYNVLSSYFNGCEMLFNDDLSIIEIEKSFARTFYSCIHLQKQFQLINEIYAKNYDDFIKSGLMNSQTLNESSSTSAQTPTTITTISSFAENYANFQMLNKSDVSNLSNTQFNLFEIMKRVASVYYSINKDIILYYSKYFSFFSDDYV